MKGRLTADGTVGGTSIELESGEALHGLVRVVWEHSVGDLPTMQAELLLMPVDGLARIRVMAAHPIAGDVRELKRIVFADGSEWEAQ